MKNLFSKMRCLERFMIILCNLSVEQRLRKSRVWNQPAQRRTTVSIAVLLSPVFDSLVKVMA